MRLIKVNKGKLLLISDVIITLLLIVIYLDKRHKDYQLISKYSFLEEQGSLHGNHEEEVIVNITNKEYQDIIFDIYGFEKKQEIFLREHLEFKIIFEDHKPYVFIGFGDLKSKNVLAFNKGSYIERTHSINKMSFFEHLSMMGDFYIPLVKADIRGIQEETPVEPMN